MNALKYASRDVVTVAPNDSLDKAISLMEEYDIHHLIVVGPGHIPVGMLSDRDLLISTGWMLTAERKSSDDPHEIIGPCRVEQIMSQPLVHATRGDEMSDIAWAMHTSKIGAIAIVNDRLLGIVTQTDLLAWLAVFADNEKRIGEMLARPIVDHMRAHVFTLRPDDTLLRAVALFKQHRIRHVPITRNDELVGIISDRDVRRALGWGGIADACNAMFGDAVRTPQQIDEVMQRSVITHPLSGTLGNVLELLLENRVHSAVITEHRRVLGIVTATDFIRLAACEELF